MNISSGEIENTKVKPAQASNNFIINMRQELRRYFPFSKMEVAHVDQLIANGQQVYFAPDELVLSPADGIPQHLIIIRSGHITGRRVENDPMGGFEYDSGDIFPVGALMSKRPVAATYRASDDVFCLLIPTESVNDIIEQSICFADFLEKRVLKYLSLSRQALQASFASQNLAEHTLDTPLGQLGRRTPVAVSLDASLYIALHTMNLNRVGSILVLDGSGFPQGILTRNDVLSRVTLPQLSLDTPVTEVMSTPVRVLTIHHTAQDAAFLMSKHNIRHIPVTEENQIVGIVSEHDLFVMHRLTLKYASNVIRAANSIEAFAHAAGEIRKLVRSLLSQGVAARQLTQLISHLNDLLVEYLVSFLAESHGCALQDMCWIVFGSEGRFEQTIATDQDNGLIFVSEHADQDRPKWLALAKQINNALDVCGFPLCLGNVMASNPACCLTLGEWQEQFEQWMERGAPDDLLKSSIYFDLRHVVGQKELAETLRTMITVRAAALPRFIKQLADNSLRNRAPLNWFGAIKTTTINDSDMLDIKLHGTAIFVDFARIYALAHGIDCTCTHDRLQKCGERLGVPPHEWQAWTASFQFLQMLRLQVQIDSVGADPGSVNMINVSTLNDIDKRMLKESLNVARRLQQKIELDYQT